MSATNSTTNYALPIFIGTDKPAWLVDWNGAMTAIDAAIKGVDTDVQGAIVDISGLSSTVASHTSSISTISGQITVITTNLNTATGNINTINSLIGNGTPTTTDQTIIGAINELHANQGDLTSLTTTAKNSLVAAINEIAGASPTPVTVAAADVTYSNTTSGLAATNVQAAIDEVNGKITGSTTISVTADGVKTNAQLLNDLFALIGSAINDPGFINAKLVASVSVMDVASIQTEQVRFGFVYVGASSATLRGAILKASGSSYGDCTLNSSGVTMGDASSTVPASGTVYKIVY